MLLAIKSRRRLNNEWGEESEIEVKIQVHMVSLLSQYVIFNRFLRIKSIFFSFIFSTQRKMAELYSDYNTYTILSFSVGFKRLDFQSSVLHEDNKIEGKSS